MSYIIWKDDYNFGLEEIDIQHYQWANLINDLYALHTEPKNADRLLDLIGKICTHLELHFNAEENLLQKNKYPYLKLQKLEHEKIISRAYRCKNEFDAYRNVGDLTDFFKFERDYFIDHTQNLDRKYLPFINKM